jgi:hydroxyethylthiazole kinase-like uncharacterized protein yjeF
MASGGFMVKLYTVKEMLALEKEANESGLTYELMMENAGKGIAEQIVHTYHQKSDRSILALVGSGNNGGDALVALSHLAADHWNTAAYIVRERENDDPLITRLVKAGGEVVKISDDKNYQRLQELLDDHQILLDGIFGTGIKLPLKGEITRTLNFITQHIGGSTKKPIVVAVDCPSGVDCETGEAATETIPADMTVTMAGVKTGLISFPAANLTGELRIANIGHIKNLQLYSNNNKIILTGDYIRNLLPPRPKNAHKGTFGTALIIAGSINYTGATLLSGFAAYRSGAGLVTIAVPGIIHTALAGHLPEATWIILPDEMGVISADAARVVRNNLDKATAILIGPGFGLEDTTREFLKKLFTESASAEKGDIGFIHTGEMTSLEKVIQKPVVLDADGLKLISKISHWHELLPAPAILTPHPGEMAVITGLKTAEIQDNRLKIASNYSKKWGHVVVLKGAFTVIASPDGQIAVVPVATPALARAGTGDVLAGLIVGFRAQGLEAFEAACAGAWIHASAGLLAAQTLGNTASVIAGDILTAIPQVITRLYKEDN